MAKQSLLALKSAMNFPVDEELKILIKEEQNLKLTSDNKEVPGFGVTTVVGCLGTLLRQVFG